MNRLPHSIALLVIFSMTVTLTSCDSGNELDGEPLSAETSAAMSETVTNLFSVLPLAISEVQLGKDQSQASTTSPTGACPDGGSFSVAGSGSGSQTSFDLDIEVSFDGCNGIDGSLALDGSGSFSQSGASFDLILDGTVSRECSLTFDRFREGLVADFVTGENTLVLDGDYRGSCSGEGFICSFNGVEVDANNATSASVLEQSCRLN
ncbi:MAG: hypothetical protein HKN37_15115 [Rhodothermales bacterium]|nr:hypothetical protein [Rhodothermales bacterium]